MPVTRKLFRMALGQRLPILDGKLELAGLERPVTIQRDRWGVPHIAAENDQDAWFAVGFCQGQDRAFQIQSLQRVASGTLAALVGARAVPIDRLTRRIGFRRIAQHQVAAQDADTMTLLRAFAAGVTAGGTRGVPKVPHELALLRRRLEPMTAVDVMAIVGLQSFLLASNWDVELARWLVLHTDGAQALADLDPAYAAEHPVTAVGAAASAPSGSTVGRLLDDLTALGHEVGLAGASNNWALAGSKTASGKPIVANDPHLPPFLPPHWYLVHVETPEWKAAGASFAGAPGLPVGHNGHAAWGITAGLIDNTDTFIEEVGADGKSVRVGDDFAPCEVIREVIEVRSGPDVVEDVLVTRHGPIIGPALQGEFGAVSLRATWMRPEPASGLLQLHRAESFEHMRTILERWPALALNVVYADTSGTIGWQLIGRAPRRRKGQNLCPFPGWDPDVGWEDDPIPFHDLPYLRDPAHGFVATANNKPTHEGPYLGADWLEGYRLARIQEALAARDDWNVPRTLGLQVDQDSLPWRAMRTFVLQAARHHSSLVSSSLLESWDGLVAVDSPAATVYESFVAEMSRRVVQARAPGSARWMLGRGFSELLPISMFALRRVGHLVSLLRRQPDGWFGRSWEDEAADALATVDRQLHERYGSDPAAWAWGQVRSLELRHPFGRAKPWGSIFNRGPFPWGGDTHTVAQASIDPQDPMANPIAIASLRAVMDVGEFERSRFSLPGGQSGNPCSPHYDDLIPLWRAGRGIPIAFTPQAVRDATRHRLRLVPDGTGTDPAQRGRTAQ